MVGLAQRELDEEKLFKLKTSNSRLSGLELKAVRGVGETAGNDWINIVVG